jgi:hypothetical protein
LKTVKNGVNPAAEELTERFKKIHNEIQYHLKTTQKTHARYYNRHTKPTPNFKVGDQV